MLLKDCSGVSTSLEDRFMWVDIQHHTSGNNEHISSALCFLREHVPSINTSLDCVPHTSKCAHTFHLISTTETKEHILITLWHWATQFRLLLSSALFHERFVLLVENGESTKKISMLLVLLSEKIVSVKRNEKGERDFSCRGSILQLFLCGGGIRRVALINVCDSRYRKRVRKGGNGA